MDLPEFPVDLAASGSVTVAPSDTAHMWGNSGSDAFSSPALLGHMERICVSALAPYLPPGTMTVGAWFEMSHLAPTPVRCTVRIAVRLTEVEGRRLVFEFEARDEVELIGRGTHHRFVVERAGFEGRLREKVLRFQTPATTP